jgi:hypothetical protein
MTFMTLFTLSIWFISSGTLTVSCLAPTQLPYAPNSIGLVGRDTDYLGDISQLRLVRLVDLLHLVHLVYLVDLVHLARHILSCLSRVVYSLDSISLPACTLYKSCRSCRSCSACSSRHSCSLCTHPRETTCPLGLSYNQNTYI